MLFAVYILTSKKYNNGDKIMKKTIQPIKFSPGKYCLSLSVFSMFIFLLFQPISFAQDLENQTWDKLIVATDINNELMSISYNGNGLVLGSKKHLLILYNF